MSSLKNIGGVFYSIAAICILLFAFFSWKDMHDVSGWFLMAFFFQHRICFQKQQNIKRSFLYHDDPCGSEYCHVPATIL